jgi:hypothetical protein
MFIGNGSNLFDVVSHKSFFSTALAPRDTVVLHHLFRLLLRNNLLTSAGTGKTGGGVCEQILLRTPGNRPKFESRLCQSQCGVAGRLNIP